MTPLPNLGKMNAWERKTVTTTVKLLPLVVRPSVLRVVAHLQGKEYDVPVRKYGVKPLEVEPSPSELDLSVIGAPTSRASSRPRAVSA